MSFHQHCDCVISFEKYLNNDKNRLRLEKVHSEANTMTSFKEEYDEQLQVLNIEYPQESKEKLRYLLQRCDGDVEQVNIVLVDMPIKHRDALLRYVT